MCKYSLLLIPVFLIFSHAKVRAIDPDTELKSRNQQISLLSQDLDKSMALLSDSDVKLKLLNIQVDPLGFLFFGPQVGMDLQIANFVAVGPYVRWNYAGLLYQAAINDWFTENPYISPGSYGVGVSAKILPPLGSGRHRPYLDLGFERFKGKESWSTSGTLGDHYYEYKGNIFHVAAGYRLVTERAFNLSIGIFMGIYKETENIDYYEFESSIDNNSLDDPRVFPGVQFLLGWQLGKN